MLEVLQEVLFQWYAEGLNQFTHSCAVGKAIYENFAGELHEQLTQPDEMLADLISDTARYTQEMRDSLEQGRDRLLEINSCNKEVAADLIAKIEAAEAPEVLDDYLELLFDCFNIGDVLSYLAKVVWSLPQLTKIYYCTGSLHN